MSSVAERRRAKLLTILARMGFDLSAQRLVEEQRKGYGQ